MSEVISSVGQDMARKSLEGGGSKRWNEDSPVGGFEMVAVTPQSTGTNWTEMAKD